ncbi:MAG TPA: PEP-CTERM sorting domain-containing protein [Verrucomicrobia bacterium]|nr:PEP-CTERM sorting domain-containing protein [Verrucomicrobiota bacterium]HOP97909.1 PEP-CTERM sorting domain-containing protein [Verrucomicrobiota bacterium]HPU57346.1 PEP-CTERM sorting domain-containing protein [Verrucomicrobiota bacterium]
MSKTYIRLTVMAALFGAASAGNAQFTQVVLQDDFDSYADTSFIVFTDGTSISLVPDGSGGNAVQYSVETGAGGFLARGFDWDPIIQPGPGGPNVSADLADYQVSFDLTINSTYFPGNGIEVWVKDEAGQGDPENDPSASLYSVSLSGFTQGVPQTVTFLLNTSINDAPFGYTEGSGFLPTVDQIRIRINGLDFNSPADQVFTFTVDNFSIMTIPEPSSAALLLGGLVAFGCRLRRRNNG